MICKAFAVFKLAEAARAILNYSKLNDNIYKFLFNNTSVTIHAAGRAPARVAGGARSAGCAEPDPGITIDAAWRYFCAARRRHIIAAAAARIRMRLVGSPPHASSSTRRAPPA